MRSYEQLKLYHKYIKQLKDAGKITIQLGEKEWIGSLTNVRDERYLLKALDVELPITNKEFPENSKNKNKFESAEMVDLTHHISWIREVLWDNKIVPFNDEYLQGVGNENRRNI